jgi:hypothetical protein
LLQSPELSLAALLKSPPAFGAIANYGNYLELCAMGELGWT